jgi:hypothetical protein
LGLRRFALSLAQRGSHRRAWCDNASCESFMKTLTHEEIYAHDYGDRDRLRTSKTLSSVITTAVGFIRRSAIGRPRSSKRPSLSLPAELTERP